MAKKKPLPIQNFSHSNVMSPMRGVLIHRVAKSQQKPIAEKCLLELVALCRKDLQLSIDQFEQEWSDIGKRLIINDYLIWCRKYEQFAHSGFYKARIEELNEMLPKH